MGDTEPDGPYVVAAREALAKAEAARAAYLAALGVPETASVRFPSAESAYLYVFLLC